MEFTLNDLQRQRVEEHLALVEQVLRRSIKTNETVDGMGHDDLYQEGCIALCRAAVSYREEMGAFPAYARTVIRNYLLDRCREIQSARKNLPSVFEVSSVCSVSIDAFCFPPHAVTDKTANDAIAIIVNVLIFIVSWF